MISNEGFRVSFEIVRPEIIDNHRALNAWYFLSGLTPSPVPNVLLLSLSFMVGTNHLFDKLVGVSMFWFYLKMRD